MIYNNTYIDELYKDCDEAEKALKTYQKYGDCGHRSSAMLERLEKQYKEAKETLCVALAECCY